MVANPTFSRRTLINLAAGDGHPASHGYQFFIASPLVYVIQNHDKLGNHVRTFPEIDERGANKLQSLWKLIASR